MPSLKDLHLPDDINVSKNLILIYRQFVCMHNMESITEIYTLFILKGT